MRRFMSVALIVAFFLTSARAVPAEPLSEQVARLQRELTALQQQVERMAGTAGQRGPQGERGPQGPAGARGDKGEPGPAGTFSIPGVSFSTGQLELKGAGGAVINAVGASGGLTRIRNSKGKDVVYLGTSSGGSGVMQLMSSAGTKMAEISVYEGGAGGNAKFFNSTGQEVIQIGLDSAGKGFVKLNGEFVKDYAEIFELTTRQGVEPGTVMAVAGPGGRIAPAAVAFDRRVVGVISGAGGLQSGTVMGSREDGSNDLPLAVSGQVYVRVGLESGPIEPGDLLVASSEPGVAMRAADPDKAVGTVIGKALEAFGHGQGKEGLVRMMVMLR